MPTEILNSFEPLSHTEPVSNASALSIRLSTDSSSSFGERYSSFSSSPYAHPRSSAVHTDQLSHTKRTQHKPELRS
eukprot:2721307-Rhodomonas_salina.2